MSALYGYIHRVGVMGEPHKWASGIYWIFGWCVEVISTHKNIPQLATLEKKVDAVLNVDLDYQEYFYNDTLPEPDIRVKVPESEAEAHAMMLIAKSWISVNTGKGNKK